MQVGSGEGASDVPKFTENCALADVVVANLHRRYTGISATVKALVPHQRKDVSISLVDTGRLGFDNALSFWQVLGSGWSPPGNGTARIWHARRDVEILAGLFLRSVLGQKWKIVFTSAAPKAPNVVLNALINQVDAVIATSPRAAGFLEWHSCVIPHGVDTDFYCPPVDRDAAYAETGLPGKYAIGQMGRIRPSKGTDLFIDAMMMLLPRYPEFTAVLCGLCQMSDRMYLSDLKRRVSAAGLASRIVFLGELPREDIRRWYQRLSLYIAASRREGFGLTPLEAMASGCPIVTSGAGAWPWIVDEEVGVVFETGSIQSLCQVLEPMMANVDRLRHMGRSARQRAVEHHSVQRESAAVNAVYADLLSGHSMPRQSRNTFSDAQCEGALCWDTQRCRSLQRRVS
jgi:mannosyltransferase